METGGFPGLSVQAAAYLMSTRPVRELVSKSKVMPHERGYLKSLSSLQTDRLTDRQTDKQTHIHIINKSNEKVMIAILTGMQGTGMDKVKQMLRNCVARYISKGWGRIAMAPERPLTWHWMGPPTHSSKKFRVSDSCLNEISLSPCNNRPPTQAPLRIAWSQNTLSMW